MDITKNQAERHSEQEFSKALLIIDGQASSMYAYKRSPPGCDLCTQDHPHGTRARTARDINAPGSSSSPTT